MEMNLPESLKELLPKEHLALCRAHPFNKDEHLFHQGNKPEFMFYIVEGEAILTRNSANGGLTTLQRCKNGFLSEASLFTDFYHCDATTTQKGLAIAIPISSLKSALKDSPFALKWIELLSKEIRRLRAQTERLGLKDIRSKLIHLIETEGKNGTFHLPTDYKSIASEIGVTHEALYRSISHLEKEGLLERSSDSLKLIKK